MLDEERLREIVREELAAGKARDDDEWSGILIEYGFLNEDGSLPRADAGKRRGLLSKSWARDQFGA